MSFGILALGCVFLVAGIAYLAYLMQIPETYVLTPVIVALTIAALLTAQIARRSRV